MVFISLFLPWVSFLGYSVSLINSSGLDALIGLVVALAGIGSAFLVRENARGTLQFIAGLAALGWMVISMLWTVSKYGSFGLNLTLQLLGIGFFLFNIGAVVMVVGGMIELKK